ncbi:MAG TPA: amylo-alpha-1,6-glucosidase [Candidatus Acidoferrales bacterium]|nr:amylo-alpha-1,6-glucosidase [Candidatus Acidoferrales bacterium]
MNLPGIRKEIAGSYERSGRLEWLAPNGLGGYSSSTLAGTDTRRYHGLLVAALHPPTGRTVLVKKLEETVRIAGKDYQLSTNVYPGTIYPTGYRYLEEFRMDPLPTLSYRIGNAVIEKEICPIRGENTVAVKYTVVSASDPILLTLDLLVNYRDFHSLTHENASMSFATEAVGRCFRIIPTEWAVPFYVWADVGAFEPTRYWYRNFIYDDERERGLDYQEDAFSPGRFVTRLNPQDSAVVGASVSRVAPEGIRELIEQQKQRMKSLRDQGGADRLLGQLFLTTEAFLARQHRNASIIAGYHWFGVWGRDTMIALPGLTLVTRRYEDAKLILERFGNAMSHGLVPNYFSEPAGTPQYNSLDATLWYFHAIRKYYQYTHDLASVKNLYPTLKASVKALQEGTLFSVKADEDLLLNIGDSNVQLTWMDAKIGNFVVTPRNGKPVEINALWHSALDTMNGIAKLLGQTEDQDSFERSAQQVATAFANTYWNQKSGCLFDRVTGSIPDASVRPNQIIAVSLPRPILSHEQENAVVKCVERELLTPYGLRTLSPNDREYVGQYRGDQKRRDLAYHQGSVWPWLLGPFVRGFIRASGDGSSARQTALRYLAPILAYAADDGLGFIPELFDGDAPHLAGGCIAQAWSVAAVLRSYYEDILDKEPHDPLSLDA